MLRLYLNRGAALAKIDSGIVSALTRFSPNGNREVIAQPDPIQARLSENMGVRVCDDIRLVRRPGKGRASGCDGPPISPADRFSRRRRATIELSRLAYIAEHEPFLFDET